MATVVSFSDECVNAAHAVKSGKATFCLYVVEGSEFQVHLIEERNDAAGSCEERWRSFIEHLPIGRCAYGFVNFSYISPTDHIERGKVVFVYWAPNDAKMKEKMVTAFSANGIITKVGEGGISARIQAGDLSSVEYSTVLDQVLARATVK